MPLYHPAVRNLGGSSAPTGATIAPNKALYFHRDGDRTLFYMQNGTVAAPDWKPLSALIASDASSMVQAGLSGTVVSSGGRFEINAGPAPVGGDIITGTADPSAGAGVSQPVVPAVYLRKNSDATEIWIKTGTPDTAWVQVPLTGAPSTADYLVGTANAGLSAEIVVGATPGGELGNTWPSPTVDATHSGSAHADFIAKAFMAAKGDLIAASANDTPAILTAGADDTILMADAAQAAGLKWVASQTPSTQAFSDAAAQGTADTYARGDHKHAMPANPATGLVETISFIIDGAGATITTGIKGDIMLHAAGTVTEWEALADQSGSIVVDLWKDTYANFPPVVADTMTGAEKPTISAATKGQDTSLNSGNGWAVTAGDIIRFNVDSITTCQRVTIALKFVRA